MKVKVNGNWVDVPAFKVTEKVGDVAVLEGDITLTSASMPQITITHNLGVVPIMCHVWLADEFTPVSGRAYASYLGNYPTTGADLTNIVVAQSNRSVSAVIDSANKLTDAIAQVYSGAGTRYFLAGNYHYKIYYQI